MQTSAVFLIVCYFLNCATGIDYEYQYWSQYAKNLTQDINSQVRNSLKGLDSLGSRISQRVNEGLKNLGPSIEEKVHEGLKPVREMQFKMRIKYGNGGTTIATFNNGKKFLLIDGTLYDCDGTISDDDASCSGTLTKSTFSDKEDFCFARIKAMINGWYCLGDVGVQAGAVNGNAYCVSSDGRPTLLIGGDEYRRLCGSATNPTSYKYFTDEPLGEYGSDVRCAATGEHSHVCTSTEEYYGDSSNIILTK